MEKIKAIYAIKDKRNDKVIYIGQTKDFRKRKNDHFSKIKAPIDKYMLEQDRTNFEMFIIEELPDDIDKESMKIKEQEYIEKFNTIENGLNKRYSGSKLFQKEHQKEYQKEREKTEKRKEYKKEYMKEYRKEYYKTEKWKEYYKTEKWKEYRKEYYKEYMRKRRQKQKEKNLI